MNKALDHYTCDGQISFTSPDSFLDYIKEYQEYDSTNAEVENAEN